MAFNPAAETARMIDSLGAEQLAKAASYTIGSHWMILGGLISSAIVTWLVVRWGGLDRLSARLSTRGWSGRTFIVSAVALLTTGLLSYPWSIYAEWYREKSYGRTSQPFTDFLMQNLTGFAISVLLGAAFFLGIYALMHRTGRRWWLWGGGFTAAVAAITLLIAPILIEPIFNDYKPVPEGPVRTALLGMADEAGIPHDRIFMFDGSRQSNNFTANVSGILGSARIAISDVALDKASLDEVKAVTGHEIGHYVLGHIWRSVALISLLSLAAFFFAERLYPWFAARFGSSAAIDEAAGLPVLLFVIGFLLTLATPILSGMTRMGEREADNYSLRTANLPDALATALVKTAEYRNPRPHPVQEFVFYTHPSVEWRVRNAMEWKAAQMANTPTP
jgi:STE24 endopeptidase